MVRDDELKRLESYANSLGITVSYKKFKKEFAPAFFDIDNSSITIHIWPGVTKTRLVLLMLHEVAHAMQWVNAGKTSSPDLIAALHKENDRKPGESIAEEYRKLIYEDEHNATHYWDGLVKLLDIRLKPSVILIRKKLDIFAYRYYYETGDFPTDTLMVQKKKEFVDEIKKQSSKRKRK